MPNRYRRKATEVVATQFTKTQNHPAIVWNDLYQTSSIQTDFGFVEIEFGDWIVEINNKIKVLKDEYFKEHYEIIPEVINRPKLIFTNDCV